MNKYCYGIAQLTEKIYCTAQLFNNPNLFIQRYVKKFYLQRSDLTLHWGKNEVMILKGQPSSQKYLDLSLLLSK